LFQPKPVLPTVAALARAQERRDKAAAEVKQLTEQRPKEAKRQDEAVAAAAAVDSASAQVDVDAVAAVSLARVVNWYPRRGCLLLNDLFDEAASIALALDAVQH
jgi:hypothetical protein